VFGFATRACLLMTVTLQSLQRDTPDDTPRSELARRAARERLAPVLTSAIALVMVALPFVVLGPRAGLEVVHPLAQVLVGGLVTAVPVTLLLVPALCLAGRRRESDTTETGDAGPDLVEAPAAVAPRSTS